MTSNPLVQRGVSRLGDRASLAGAVIGALVIFIAFMTQHATWQLVLLLGLLSAGGFARLDGQSLARWPHTVAQFVTRSRWTGCRFHQGADHDHGLFRGPFERHWARATFRGRLDLTETQRALWQNVEELLRRLATRDTPTRLGVYEIHDGGESSAWLCGDTELAWPEPWHVDQAPEQLRLSEPWYFEGWSHVRTKSRYVAVLRVSSDSVHTGNFFRRIAPPASPWRVSVHVEVQARSRALQRVRRASHATTADDQFSRTLGFVNSAQRDAERRSVFEREQLVVGGDALLRLAVLVTCEGESPDALRGVVQRATEHIRSAGARVERGYGRQLEWFRCAVGAPS